MIKVEMKRNKDEISKIIISGHSGYEESGKDDISCFMPDVFCFWWEQKDVPFISRFLKTQMFENFKMRKLMEIDAE